MPLYMVMKKTRLHFSGHSCEARDFLIIVAECRLDVMLLHEVVCHCKDVEENGRIWQMLSRCEEDC